MINSCGCKAGPRLGDVADHEEPSFDDMERFASETVTCRSCGAEAYDQLDDCPRCNEPLRSSAARSSKTMVGLGLGLAGLIVVLALASAGILPP